MQISEQQHEVTSSLPKDGLSFRRIVVGFQREPQAEKAFRTAASLAAEFGAELIVCEAIPEIPVTSDTVIHPIHYREVLQEVKESVREFVELSGSMDSTPFHVEVGYGKPAEVLLKCARIHGADLIVVGSHGHGALPLLFIGSVSETVAALASCPVLIIGPTVETSTSPLKNILFATDLEDTDRAAAEYASSLAELSGASLTVMHSIAHKSPLEQGQRVMEEENARSSMRKLISVNNNRHVSALYKVSYGSANVEILAAAAEIRADLIVLGSGLHRAMSSHLPWRTLALVMQGATCPVLNVSPHCDRQMKEQKHQINAVSET